MQWEWEEACKVGFCCRICYCLLILLKSDLEHTSLTYMCTCPRAFAHTYTKHIVPTLCHPYPSTTNACCILIGNCVSPTTFGNISIHKHTNTPSQHHTHKPMLPKHPLYIPMKLHCPRILICIFLVPAHPTHNDNVWTPCNVTTLANFPHV